MNEDDLGSPEASVLLFHAPPLSFLLTHPLLSPSRPPSILPRRSSREALCNEGHLAFGHRYGIHTNSSRSWIFREAQHRLGREPPSLPGILRARRPSLPSRARARAALLRTNLVLFVTLCLIIIAPQCLFCATSAERIPVRYLPPPLPTRVSPSPSRICTQRALDPASREQ